MATSLHKSGAVRVPQYGLRSLFIAVTACGVLFGLMGTIGPLPSMVLGFVLMMVFLHVAGNALGTRLREAAAAELADRTELERPITAPPQNADRQTHVWTRLNEKAPLSRMIRFTVIVGALCGSACGGSALWFLAHAQMPGVIVGAMSSAVIGAFFGFLTGSFLEIALRAWWQASSDSSS